MMRICWPDFEKHKIFLMGILLMMGAIATYYINVAHKLDQVFTHLYYIPIVLGALWWRYRGVIVTAILAIMLVAISNIYSVSSVESYMICIRIAIFFVVSLLTAFVSNRVFHFEHKVAKINSELTKIFNASLNGMLIVNPDKKIMRVNRAFLEMFQYEENQVLNKKCTDVIGNCFCLTARCPITQNLAEGHCKELDIELKSSVGKTLYCVISAFTLQADSRNNIYSVIDIRDITDRKMNEKKFALHHKQLRTMASELSLAEERERRRLSTNLHDSVSQTLFISKLRLSALMKKSSDKEFDELNLLHTDINRALNETRTLMFELSPPILYELGFEAAIEWLVEKIQKDHNVNIELECDPSKRELGFDICIVLFQTIRELLNNTVKHASASNIVIQILKGKHYIRCVVKDDGKGFDTEILQTAMRGNGGFGLFNIRERLNHFEGNLTIDSQAGGGTEATVLAPYKFVHDNSQLED